MKIDFLLKKIATLTLMLPSLSFAFVYGGSNIPLGDYPKFTESPPYAPYLRDEREFESYRYEVQRYVERAKEYVENARHDQKRAQESAEEAIEKANRAVEEFNNWARRGY